VAGRRLTQIELAGQSLGQWRFAGSTSRSRSPSRPCCATGCLAAPELDARLRRVLGLLIVFAADDEYGSPLAPPTLPVWLAYAAALLWALWSAAGVRARSLAVAHLAWLWTLALAASMQMKDIVDANALAQGWEFLCVIAPVTLMTLGLWRRPGGLAWPRAEAFDAIAWAGSDWPCR
jgi:hypothetical protein